MAHKSGWVPHSEVRSEGKGDVQTMTRAFGSPLLVQGDAEVVQLAAQGGPVLGPNQCIRHLIHRHEPPTLAIGLKVGGGKHSRPDYACV